MNEENPPRILRLRHRLAAEPAFTVLTAAAFAAPFSLPLGRFLLALTTLLLAIHCVRRRRRPWIAPVAWIGFAFLSYTCLVTLRGVHPALGVPKLDKLAWFVGIPVTAVLVHDLRRLRVLFYALCAGSTVLALEICVTHPVRALAAVRSGAFASLGPAVIDQGSMTDGQRLAVGLLATAGLLAMRRAAGREPGRPRMPAGPVVLLSAALALQTAALILNFKRGSWIAALVAMGIFTALQLRWRSVAALAAVVALCLFLPPVQQRVAALRSEFDPYHGGRMTMWRKIAPALIAEHPWGIGYRSLTNRMMRAIAPEVEAERDHLHSNLLQVLVETGWAGLALYLAWMARGVWDGGVYVRRIGDSGVGQEKPLALALLLMLVLLLLNGLVEYNLGDAEIVLLYGFILGAGAAGDRRRRSS